ncbi:MAG: MBL fold metallo-hydrolase, partial [Chloroflexi bacterium]|nr:MBL fold metallo-hydrolase [Chloroflexota bacterium]
VIPCSFEGGRTINISLFCGERRLLVDAGVASTPRECILPALQRLHVAPTELDWLVVLHAHADHLGGCAALRAASGDRLRIAAHALDARAIADHHYFATQVNGITDEARLEAFLARCGGDVPVYTILTGGETIDLGGLSLEVIYAPGHTAGNISLFERAHGVLVHGESVMGVGATDAEGWRTTWQLGLDPAAYRHALQTLAALPFERFISSHEPPLDRQGGLLRIGAALAQLDEFEAHVEAARTAGARSAEQIAAATAEAGRYRPTATFTQQVAALLRARG